MRKRPCRICHRWFRPHPRAGDRQRTCSAAPCQAERRRRAVAAWRRRHPDYDRDDRLRRRLQAAPHAVAAGADPLAQLNWEAARHGRSTLDTDAAVAFLSEAMADGRISPPWSDSVSVRIGRCLLGVLRDVGLLREPSRRRRELVAYRMSNAGVAILTRDLYELGLSDAALCEHPDWSLFGMSRTDVLSRLNELGEAAGLIVQSAGSVVRITWTVESIAELIDVLARHNV